MTIVPSREEVVSTTDGARADLMQANNARRRAVLYNNGTTPARILPSEKVSATIGFVLKPGWTAIIKPETDGVSVQRAWYSFGDGGAPDIFVMEYEEGTNA